MMNKFLDPRKYLAYVGRKWVRLNFFLGRRVLTSSSALGVDIRFFTHSEKEYYWRAHDSYRSEKTTMFWIENVIGLDEVVYDVGANVGAYSLLIAALKKRVGHKGKVFAFEPESLNFASLNKNIMLNGLSDFLMAYPLAFSDLNQVDTFFLSSNIEGSATHGLRAAESDGVAFDATHTQGTVSMRLDRFVGDSDVPFPDHIKIDVDGMEGRVIDGMAEVLASDRLKSICIEIADALSHGELEQKILSCGFRIETEESWVLDGKTTKNIVFLRR